jgi:hypothetical protein
LSSAGLGSSAALLANVVNGGINVGMTIVAIRLLDRTGRRPLLLSGTTGMAAGMIVIALTFLIGGDHLHGATVYIAVAGLLIYTGSFAIGLDPVFWLLISEIYPVKIRGKAMSRDRGQLGRELRGHHLLPHPAGRHRKCRDPARRFGSGVSTCGPWERGWLPGHPTTPALPPRTEQFIVAGRC